MYYYFEVITPRGRSICDCRFWVLTASLFIYGFRFNLMYWSVRRFIQTHDHDFFLTLPCDITAYMLFSAWYREWPNYPPPPASRRGWGYSDEQFRTYVRTFVCMCVVYVLSLLCNNFIVYTITRNILDRSAAFLWAHSGLLASMSLHLGSATLLEVLRQGSVLFEYSCCKEKRNSYSIYVCVIDIAHYVVVCNAWRYFVLYDNFVSLLNSSCPSQCILSKTANMPPNFLNYICVYHYCCLRQLIMYNAFLRTAAVVRGSLHRSGAGSWATSRSRRQVPTATQVPATKQHLGRWADRLLLQGTLTPRSQRVLRRQALSDVRREATVGRADWTYADTDRQLVQKQTSERSFVTTTTIGTALLCRVVMWPAVSVRYCLECVV